MKHMVPCNRMQLRGYFACLQTCLGAEAQMAPCLRAHTTSVLSLGSGQATASLLSHVVALGSAPGATQFPSKFFPQVQAMHTLQFACPLKPSGSPTICFQHTPAFSPSVQPPLTSTELRPDAEWETTNNTCMPTR